MRRSGGVRQPVGLQHLLYGRPRPHTLVPAAQIRMAAQVDVRVVHRAQPAGLAPAGQREQIRIGDREGVARQIRVAVELPVDPCKAAVELPAHRIDVFARLRRVQQRNEPLVDLRAEEVQPFHQPVARERSVCRRESGFGAPVGQILRDHGAFAQRGAVVEHEQRHVAEFVHGTIVAAIVEPMPARVHRDDLRVELRFAQHDADRLRAAAGSVIELHAFPCVNVSYLSRFAATRALISRIGAALRRRQSFVP